MVIETVRRPESEQPPIADRADVFFSSFYAGEIDIIALRLWQRGCCLEPVGDVCCYCKGEAQRCLGLCQ
jgi:hypothetical protein